MAHKKENLIIKKYNPETDVVPVSPTTFSVGVDDDEGDSIFLEFAYDSRQKNQRVILGSFVLSNKMAHGLVDMLQETFNKIENTKENETEESK